MAKGKRRSIEFYTSLLKVGLPEVDKIIQDHSGYDEGLPYDCTNARVSKNNTEDRISRMPEDILQFIISSLTMREGAATSILSRRWRRLWSTSASRLHFNHSNLFGYEYDVDTFSDKKNALEKEAQRCPRKIRIHRIPQPRRIPRRSRITTMEGFLESEQTKFLRRVNRILKLRRASRIDKFSVSFPLGQESASHVDRWMELAAAQGVTELVLDFSWSHFYRLNRDGTNEYKFPVRGFGSSLKYLRLRFCDFDFPPGFQGLNSLVTLHLADSYLTINNLQNILANCPLEWLSLKACYFPDPTILKFVGPSIPLKHLDISRCYCVNEIELRDVNLLSFELYARKEKLSMKNVPHLSRLVVYTEGPVEIMGNVPCLETLFLKHERSKLPNSSAFNNLKRLVFSANDHVSNLFEVVCLLETCPLLQQLELDMGIFYESNVELDESTKIRTMPESPHNNLYEVVIYAFESHPEQIELAKYLLKNAIVLEKMKIYTTCKRYQCNGIWRLSENGKLVGKALEKVCKLLQNEARPSTELLLLSTSAD